MGYTHYWYRPKEIDADTYAAIMQDAAKVLQLCQEQGIQLGDAQGVGSPEITANTLRFNGLAECGHSAEDTCGGNCSYESFWFDRKDDEFSFCKTELKPYDIAVTATLIVIKHYLPIVRVTSDGGDEEWADGRMVCMMACGYGEDFQLDEPSL